MRVNAKMICELIPRNVVTIVSIHSLEYLLKQCMILIPLPELSWKPKLGSDFLIMT